jgi:hypothetical protein
LDFTIFHLLAALREMGADSPATNNGVDENRYDVIIIDINAGRPRERTVSAH